MTELEILAKPYVGRYPMVPLDEMTTREWGWVTDLTSYMPRLVDQALAGGDPRLVTMMAVVSLVRAGKVAHADVAAAYERLIDQPAFTTVDFVTDAAEEADADPPPTGTAANEPSSGASSSSGSDSSAAGPNGSGTPPSGSSPLPPVRSGI